MNVVRNEIRTGLLVLFSLAVLVGALIYLGAPGVFTKQKEFAIYFDNAAGIKLGTPVMLAGRKVGQVIAIDSPVPAAERPLIVDEKGKPRNLESRVTVRVDADARIYNDIKVALANYTFISEPVIDFTEGVESSGLAPGKKHFVGERPAGLVNVGLQILDRIDPVVDQLNKTLKSLEETANNLTKVTDEGADFQKALEEIRKVAANLNEVTASSGPLTRALNAIENTAGKDGEIAKAVADFRKLVAPDSDLAKTLANAEKFTRDLNGNKDVPAMVKNLRTASDRLNVAIASLQKDFGQVADNLEQASDTVKRQPWRLIWPSTKKYPEEQAQRKPKAKPTPTPPPKRRR
jgi:ABC-type transporter Mla subunit MlaD